MNDSGALLIALLPGLLVYAYTAYSLQVIAKKTNTPNGWFAWIPILNFLLMLSIGNRPILYIILLFIPLINLFVLYDIWANIGQARGKGSAMGCLIFIPIINFFVPGYLAFTD